MRLMVGAVSSIRSKRHLETVWPPISTAERLVERDVEFDEPFAAALLRRDDRVLAAVAAREEMHGLALRRMGPHDQFAALRD